MLTRKLLLTATLASLLSACQPADTSTTANAISSQPSLPEGVTLIETHVPADGDVGIPYSKYQLDNGLTVVLHDDQSDPLVHVDVTYHVGSAREEFGKSGFAHFFEHMMFQGSENVADEEHFKIVTEAGGTMNGSTNRDRTNYYQTVPANQLEKVLWLEADRMGFLLDSVTQEKFEIQRETVKNERGQNYDNRPYGLISEKTAEALYPQGHPYSWLTIGYLEDLDRVNVNDLKAFFQRWYGPNNATITIGGDIDTATTLSWVKKYFAPIPRGPEVIDAEKAMVALDETRYVTYEDQVHMPLLFMTFPTVHIRHADEAPLDVLSSILGGGKTSLFFKNLVKNGMAVQAWVSHPCSELACEFQLGALANPSTTPELAKLEQVFAQTLDEFAQRGVEQDDLDRVKASIESSTIYGLQSVRGKVSTLASNQTFDAQPDMVQYDLDRYNNVSKEDVMRVFNQYIKGKNSVVLSIVPKGQAQLAAKPANFEFARQALPEYQQLTEDDLNIVKVEDTFDRSVMPKAGMNPAVQVPEYWTESLPNGIEVAGHQTTETPTTNLTLTLEGGHMLEPLEKAGLASLTAQMLSESTQRYTTEEFSNQLALLGSSISVNSSASQTTIRVSSLSKNLDETLALMQEMLFHPAMLEEDFARLKQQNLQSLQQALKNAEVLASRAADLLLLGENNRVGLPSDGTLETVAAITLDDVKAFYSKYYNPAHSKLVVVGNIEKKALLKKFDFLANWKVNDYALPDYKPFPALKSNTIFLVDKPDAAQSVIVITKRAMPFDATGDYFKSRLMNFPLGGMFNSRINLNLREDKGYTYGARSGFTGGKKLGRFTASASVKKPNTGDSLQEFFTEINRYQQSGMSEAELAMMRSSYTQRDALKFETPSQKARFINQLLTFGLDSSYVADQTKLINSISRDELNKLAAEQLQLDDMVIVVVGDKASILPQLESLGLPIEDLDVPQ